MFITIWKLLSKSVAMTTRINHLLSWVSVEAKWRALHRRCKSPPLREMDITGDVVWADDRVHIPKENIKQIAFRHTKQLKCTMRGRHQSRTFPLQGRCLIQTQAPRHILQITDKHLRSVKVCQQLICFLLQGWVFFPHTCTTLYVATHHICSGEKEKGMERKKDR